MKRWTEGDAPPGVAELLRSHDVEPSSASSERVWRRLQASRTPRGSPVTWSIGLAVAATILLLLSFPVPESELWVRSAKGPVWADQDRVQAGQALSRPVVFRTGTEAEVELETRTGDRIRLSAGGELGTSTSGGWSLDEGEVEIWAQPRRAGAPLVVRTGAWTVTVLGTRFQVERVDPGDVRVSVREGLVRIEGPSGRSTLRSGESFDSRPALTVPMPEARTRLPQPLEASTEPAPIAPKRRRINAPTAPRVPAEAAAPPAPEPEATQSETLSRAKSVSDVDEAVALFDDAADMGPPLDEVAAFRAAQRLRHAGRFTEAITRLKAHVGRWPSGELTEVAWLDAVRLQLEDGRLEAAQNDLLEYEALFLASANQPEVAFLRAEVLRALGDHDGAARAYLTAARSPRFAERARFLRGLSLARAGRVEAARDALQEFLKRHPQSAHAAGARKILDGDRKSEVEAGVGSFIDTQKEGLQ